MKVARITVRGSPPVILSAVLKPPTIDKIQVKVLAVGISQQVRNRVDADHPMTKSWLLPFDPSTDGVVKDEANGDLYYVLPRGPKLLAERLNVPRRELLKLPANVDPVKIAGQTGAWLTSWAFLMACTRRKVVIIGATTCNGRAAAQIARFLGASEIIGFSDDEAALARVPGLTIRAALGKPEEFPKVQNVAFVIDFIGSENGAEVLNQINPGPIVCELLYVPAWGPRGGEPFFLDGNLLTQKGLRIIDPALLTWRLTSQQNWAKLRFALNMMTRIHTPFDIVEKPMTEVAEVWNHEDFKSLNKVLVLVPSKA
jgi:hypothetical protein